MYLLKFSYPTALKIQSIENICMTYFPNDDLIYTHLTCNFVLSTNLSRIWMDVKSSDNLVQLQCSHLGMHCSNPGQPRRTPTPSGPWCRHSLSAVTSSGGRGPGCRHQPGIQGYPNERPISVKGYSWETITLMIPKSNINPNWRY